MNYKTRTRLTGLAIFVSLVLAMTILRGVIGPGLMSLLRLAVLAALIWFVYRLLVPARAGRNRRNGRRPQNYYSDRR